MSDFIPISPTPAGVYQRYFGTPPGSQDAKTECKNWQMLCAEVLADREKIRETLERERIDRFWKESPLHLTMAEVYAQVDHSTTLEEIIADLKKELEDET